MSTKTNTAAIAKLVELLEANPALMDIVQLRDADEPKAEVEMPQHFDGEVVYDEDRPVLSKSGQSVKYEAEGFATDSEGVSHKVIVVAYLPPKAAREKLTFGLSLDGKAIEGRQPKRARS